MAANDPANIILGKATLTVGVINMGLTQGGVSLRKTNEYLDIPADQVKGTAVKKRISESMFLTTTLLEGTLANMLIAFAEPATNTAGAGTDLAFGSQDAEEIEHAITVVGPPPGTTNVTRTFTFHRGVLVEDVEHMLGARDAAGLLPITFELLKDSNNGYNFGFFTDAA